MATPFIAIPLADSAALTPSSQSAAMPATNVQKKQPGDVWRPTTLTPSLDIDLGVETGVNFAAVIVLNASATAQWRVMAAASAADLPGAPWFDSGWMSLRAAGVSNDWPYFLAVANFSIAPVSPPATPDYALKMDFANDVYELVTNPGQAGGNPVSTFRYWRFEISDPANTDGYLDIGRIYLSNVTVFTEGARADWETAYRTSSRKRRAVGGQRYATVRPQERYLDFTIELGSGNDMLGRALSYDLARGIARDVIAVMDIDETAHLAQHMIYGEFEELTPVSMPVRGFYTKRFRIEELLP